MTPPITARFDAEFTLSGVWLPAQPTADYFPGIETPDRHQVEMRDILMSDGPSVALNTNPTGAGKTLSWGAPTIRSGERGDGWIVVATYPTNALVADQLQMLQSLVREYYTNPPEALPDGIQLDSEGVESPVVQTENGSFPLEERVLRVTGEDTLGESTIAEMKRVLAVASDASIAGLPTIILTTPDLLTLVAKRIIDDPDVRGLVMGVDAIVVDEFHLSNPRAKRHLPFYLDFYQNRLGGRTVLDNLVFLSATPDTEYISQIQRGMEPTIVTRDWFSEEPQQPARQILPETILYSMVSSMFTNSQWICDHILEVVEWLESGEKQSLIMVDSVREVESIAHELDENTALSVGKIYGWKRVGRQEVVESSDVLVGNTAMEVGIDFAAVDRILTTGYTPDSALQRVGRMRAREGLDECEIALITTAAGHDALCREATNGRLSRRAFERALHEIGEASEIPYYGLLCALYFEYHWEDSSSPIGEGVRRQDKPVYKETIYEHFRKDGERYDINDGSPEEFWDELHNLRSTVYGTGIHPIFEEMHHYRSSSLSVAIIDKTDPDERLKEYSLHYILRYGRGKFIPREEAVDVLRDVTDGEPTDDDLRVFEAIQERTVGTFLLHDLFSNPFDIGLADYSKVTVWRGDSDRVKSEVMCIPDVLSTPTLRRLNGDVKGSEYIRLDGKILAQYVRADQSTARSRFGLGPYANIYPVGESEVLVLWQDAILAHANIMDEFYESQ